MQIFNTLMPRPQGVPEHYLICNAPRPIIGDMLWEGDFIHGRFYAALDPENPEFDICVRENTALDAWHLIFWTEAEARDRVKEAYPKYAHKVDSLSFEQLYDTFRNVMKREERTEA